MPSATLAAIRSIAASLPEQTNRPVLRALAAAFHRTYATGRSPAWTLS